MSDENTVPPESAQRLLAVVEQIGREVAAPNADDVDARARFPREAIDALRAAKVLSAAVPTALGGAGLGITDLSQMCFSLAQYCSATAMILAMHHIQVACIADYGDTPEWQSYLRQLVKEQRLIASVTSEVGPSGDMRQSVAATVLQGGTFSLTKHATTISYGAHADDLLITTRRDATAMSNDQVLVLAQWGQFQLENPGVWDTMGMRGTCSAGATVHATGPGWQVLKQPFGEIASRTMVPYSHCLWGGVWLGIATEAVRRARALARAKARKSPGQLPVTAQHLSQVVAKLQLMRNEVQHAGVRATELRSALDTQTLDGVGYAIQMNNLKLNASEMLAEILADVMRLSGISGYNNRGEYSCARLLRDGFSAAVMINNYRLRETNATLLMVHKGV
jgi:acyl-CoA dehydrogenase